MKKILSFLPINVLLLSGSLAVLAAAGLAAVPEALAAPSPTSTAQPGQNPAMQGMPGMPPFLDRLAPPPTVYPPAQADLGAQVYYQVCMACHGDLGQGLTDEWRQVLDAPDRDCWQSGCHNPHHPPGGFVFPKVVPAVVGSTIMEQFQTAANLHAFIQGKMPYQAPGSLEEAEYWQLTAYLLRANGYSLPAAPLDEQTAQRYSLAAEPVPPARKPPYIPLAAGFTAGFILLLLLLLLLRRRQS
jgi:mono/diheme cytochrome c family protein